MDEEESVKLQVCAPPTKETPKVRRVYLRCNSGHYYSSIACPLDGWMFNGAAELMAAASRLERKNEPLSVERLVEQGVPKNAVERAIVIDFGSNAVAFHALVPEGYVVQPGFKTLRELGSEYH